MQTEAIFNVDKAKIVFDILIDSFDKKAVHWFSDDNLPQKALLPEGLVPGSAEHTKFLFFIAPFMRARVDSSWVFKRFQILYNSPENNYMGRQLFIPEQHIKQDFNVILWIDVCLARAGLTFKSDEFVKIWHTNALNLKNFQYDPLKIFENIVTYSDVWEKMIGNGFIGWREKILSLLTLWYQEAGLLKRQLLGVVPVDFHALRVMMNTGVVVVSNEDDIFEVKAEAVIKNILPFLRNFCYEQKVFVPSLSAALWLLSKFGCSNQKECYLCPIRKFCQFSMSYYSQANGKVIIKKKQQLLLL